MKHLTRLLLTPLIALAAIVLGGCGVNGHHFNPNDPRWNQGHANVFSSYSDSYTTIPKMDLLLVIDDTDSFSHTSKSFTFELKGFLSQLEKNHLDYHFTTLPLTQDHRVRQVAASVNDGNWGAAWMPSYPGAPVWDSGSVNPDSFRTFKTYTDFVDIRSDASLLNGFEPGLATLKKNLETGMGESHFLRDDSILIIFFIGNGNDTSLINFCDEILDSSHFHRKVPCGSLNKPACIPTADDPTGGDPHCDSEASSLNYYLNTYRKIHPNLKIFAATALSSSASSTEASAEACPANVTQHLIHKGHRYQKLAQQTNGEVYDICKLSWKAIFNSFTESLQNAAANMRVKYVFLGEEPDSKSIRVFRSIGGVGGRSKEIPHDALNGWNYEGFVQDAFAISGPMPLNRSTGYALGLNGKAELSGKDSVRIEYHLRTKK